MISLRSVLTPLNLTSVRALENVTHSADFTQIPDESLRRQASRALIMRHHERVGGLRGPIGIPMGDLRPVDNGFTKPYSGGFIELLDFDNGPKGFRTHSGEVHFVGFRCNKESDHDQSTPADEPYFIVSVQGASDEGRVTKRFGPFEDVDTGENTFVCEFVTADARPPFSVLVVGMENDRGSPDEASAKVETAVNAAAAKLQLSLVVLGVNPAIGSMIQTFLNIFGDWVGDAATAVFGLGDDTVGQNQISIFNYDRDLNQWLDPEPITDPSFEGKPYNVKLDVGNDDEGQYTLFFDVHLFETTKIPVGANQ